MTIQIQEIFGSNGYYINRDGLVTKQNRTINSRAGGHKKRYLRVSINGIDHYLQRLVLAAFVGECPKGYQACHNDGNPHNNKLSNLRWDTPSNNSKDKIKHGTNGAGELNSMSKISNEDAAAIIHSYCFLENKILSDIFKIGRASVSGIATGKIRYNDQCVDFYEKNKLTAKERINRYRNAN